MHLGDQAMGAPPIGGRRGEEHGELAAEGREGVLAQAVQLAFQQLTRARGERLA